MCLNPGDTIGGRYRIQSQLRQGGFGRTYLAEDVNLPDHPQCLVKEITPLSNNLDVLQETKRRFDQEARVLKRLGQDCSQIPTLFASFRENRKFYLVQELIEGNPLSKELTPGRQLNEGEVIELLRSILEIIKFVHDCNVIHRDINPSNLIRRKQNGEFVLIDFGTVKQISILGVDSSGQLTLTACIGTNGYMPPEQASGQPRLCSDIYAVGMIGIKALTGREPGTLLKDEKTDETVWRSISGQPMVQVSDGLATILNNMVRYNFRERYQSADKVLQDLADLQNLAAQRRTPQPPRPQSNTLPAPPNLPQPEHVAHLQPFQDPGEQRTNDTELYVEESFGKITLITQRNSLEIWTQPKILSFSFFIEIFGDTFNFVLRYVCSFIYVSLGWVLAIVLVMFAFNSTGVQPLGVIIILFLLCGILYNFVIIIVAAWKDIYIERIRILWSNLFYSSIKVTVCRHNWQQFSLTLETRRFSRDRTSSIPQIENIREIKSLIIELTAVTKSAANWLEPKLSNWLTQGR